MKHSKIMKTLTICVILLAALIICTSCAVVQDPSFAQYYMLASEKQFKGIELYFFEVDGEYRYVMIGGTNRHKFADEINALPLATAIQMRDIISTMTDEIKETVVVTYLDSYPCPDGAVNVFWDEDNADRITAARLLLGLN